MYILVIIITYCPASSCRIYSENRDSRAVLCLLCIHRS